MEDLEKQSIQSEPEKENADPELYDIREVDGGFEVTLPGLFDEKREAIVGTRKERFRTKEEADQAVERVQENVKEYLERASLKKTFTYFYRINKAPDGKFCVVLPGLIDSKTGNYVGTIERIFDSWKQAKEYFLEQKENEEALTQNPLLEIQTGEDERIAFSDLDAFNPHVAPSEKSHEIPNSIKKYLLDKEKLAGTDISASTYQETIKEKDWERKLYSFVVEYLEKNGPEIAKQLGIENLESLTPKQAIELATQIVIDLTKYKWSDSGEQKLKSSEKLEKTKADQSTALQLLREGQLNKENSDWEGNGVCRNFASLVKAVFEALKANQTRFNQLRDTYCLYEGDTETFAPKREDTDVFEMQKSGHAWNTFVTVSR
jgi:hypothetical protein